MGYDDESQPKTVYNSKVEKLLKKGGGTYVVGFWSEEETYQDDAVDCDVSKYALAADLMCEDLTVHIVKLTRHFVYILYIGRYI